MTTITFSAIGSNSARKWQVLLSARIFCCAGLDAQMPERRLVERLHALARHGDADAADGQQRHGPEIDLAPAGDGPGGAHLAVAEPGDAEGALERLDALGSRAPAERDGDVGALAGPVRRGRGLRIAEIADHRPLRAERTSASSTPVVSAVAPQPGLSCVSQSTTGREAVRAIAIASRTPSSGDTIGTANSGSRSAISRVSASAARSAACLAPGVGDHGRPAPVEVGGREAGEVGEVDQLALGHHRAGDDALRRLDQRALVVERDQERQLAQRAARRGGRARAAATGRGRRAARSRRGRRADRCGRRPGCR